MSVTCKQLRKKQKSNKRWDAMKRVARRQWWPGCHLRWWLVGNDLPLPMRDIKPKNGTRVIRMQTFWRAKKERDATNQSS